MRSDLQKAAFDNDSIKLNPKYTSRLMEYVKNEALCFLSPLLRTADFPILIRFQRCNRVSV